MFPRSASALSIIKLPYLAVALVLIFSTLMMRSAVQRRINLNLQQTQQLSRQKQIGDISLQKTASKSRYQTQKALTANFVNPSNSSSRIYTFKTNDVNKEEIGCTDKSILTRFALGRWVPRTHTHEELQRVQKFLNTTRDYMGFPATLQRSDGKCGDVDFEKNTDDGVPFRSYRALCNPFGETPCCYENKCVAKSLEECRCVGCVDVRQQIHAELAEWVPANSGCKLMQFKDGAEACAALEGFTIHFLGDSFIRQIFVAFMRMLKERDLDLKSKDELHRCNGYYLYHPYCAQFLPRAVRPCKSTTGVGLRKTLVNQSSQQALLLTELKRYVGKKKSLVVIGMGLRDNYSDRLVIEKIGKPVVETLSKAKSTWPKVVWVSPHSPGLLTSSLDTKQLPPSVRSYNDKVNAFFASEGIPVLDTFGLTKDGVMSFDGLHYGDGVNRLKATILVNYVNSLRSLTTG